MFTDAEMYQQNVARARTLTPINEYQGGFTKPVLLIARELGLDEVEIVSGPHRD